MRSGMGILRLCLTDPCSRWRRTSAPYEEDCEALPYARHGCRRASWVMSDKRQTTTISVQICTKQEDAAYLCRIRKDVDSWVAVGTAHGDYEKGYVPHINFKELGKSVKLSATRRSRCMVVLALETRTSSSRSKRA